MFYFPLEPSIASIGFIAVVVENGGGDFSHLSFPYIVIC